MLRLLIRLLSPVCPATGVGRPGYVDRDVVYDGEGLPELPGRRLKGLWRDAFREIRESQAISSFPISKEEDLFGHSGAAEPAAWRVDNARLADAGALRLWLRAMRQRVPLRREDIVARYTEIRRQTKIDRRLGRAEDETLRAVRMLKRGLEFQAAVNRVRGAWSAREKLALGLAAAALQAMGSARHRGSGQVSCRLFEDTPQGGSKDWTEEALKRLEQGDWDVDGASTSSDSQLPDQPGQAELAAGDGTWYRMRFRIEPREPALFPVLEGDPFTVFTSDNIPGSSIRGALARRYLAKIGNSPDEQFYRIFCGDVRFLSANPALDDASGNTTRLSPLPHSIRRVKDYQAAGGTREYKAVDLVDLQDDNDEPLQRFRDWWVPLDSLERREAIKPVVVESHLQYHHQRTPDRRAQRALGAEEEGYAHVDPALRGALFTYESIRPGQIFAGEMVGPKQALMLLRGLLQTGETLCLGRSKSAQYGAKAEWKWLDPEPALAMPHGGSQPCSQVKAILESPLIAVNENGHPSPRFPEEELGERLCGAEVAVERSIVRVSWQGAYLAHQKLPRQQMPALAAGSVFILSLTPPCSTQALGNAALEGFGLRVEDGFGRVRFEPIDPSRDDGQTGFEMYFDKEVAPKPEKDKDVKLEASDDPRRKLATDLLRDQVMDRASQLGLEHSRNCEMSDSLTPHLVARLQQMLAQHTKPEDFAARLRRPEPGRARPPEMLRDTAMRKLEKAHLRQPLERTLATFLCETATPQQELLKERRAGRENAKEKVQLQKWEGIQGVFFQIADTVYSRSPGWRDCFGANPLLQKTAPEGGFQEPSDPDFAARVVRCYLETFLGGLARLKRKERRARDRTVTGGLR